MLTRQTQLFEMETRTRSIRILNIVCVSVTKVLAAAMYLVSSFQILSINFLGFSFAASFLVAMPLLPLVIIDLLSSKLSQRYVISTILTIALAIVYFLQSDTVFPSAAKFIGVVSYFMVVFWSAKRFSGLERFLIFGFRLALCVALVQFLELQFLKTWNSNPANFNLTFENLRIGLPMGGGSTFGNSIIPSVFRVAGVNTEPGFFNITMACYWVSASRKMDRIFACLGLLISLSGLTILLVTFGLLAWFIYKQFKFLLASTIFLTSVSYMLLGYLILEVAGRQKILDFHSSFYERISGAHAYFNLPFSQLMLGTADNSCYFFNDNYLKVSEYGHYLTKAGYCSLGGLSHASFWLSTGLLGVATITVVIYLLVDAAPCRAGLNLKLRTFIIFLAMMTSHFASFYPVVFCALALLLSRHGSGRQI